jgi:hypothetical protein
MCLPRSLRTDRLVGNAKRTSDNLKFMKGTDVKQFRRLAAGAVASLGLGLAAAAYAHPGQMGAGMGEQMGPGMRHGMQGMGGPGAMGGAQLLTPEERQAFVEKMRSAKTPEERQKLAETNRAEMEKRAKEKGVTLPPRRGPHATPPADEAHKH